MSERHNLEALFAEAARDESGPSPERLAAARGRLHDLLSVDATSSPNASGARRAASHAPSLARSGAVAKIALAAGGVIVGLSIGVPIGMRIGVSTTTAASREVREAPPAPVRVPEPPAPSTSPTSTAATAPAMPLPISPPSAEKKTSGSPTKEAPSDTLASEETLLRSARTALERHDYAAAKDAIDAHATRFSRGQLAEERESLAVVALAGLGRTEQARKRAAAFRLAYPRSMLQGVVDDAVARLP